MRSHQLLQRVYKLGRYNARIMNITIFLGTWGATKLPQVLVEFKFLGVEFTLVLQALTVISVFLIGLIMECLLSHQKAIVN